MVPISAVDFLRRAASPPLSTGDNLATGAARIAAFKPPLIVMSSSCVNERLTCHLGIHAQPMPKKKGGNGWVGKGGNGSVGRGGEENKTHTNNLTPLQNYHR